MRLSGDENSCRDGAFPHRSYWLDAMIRITSPVFSALAQGKLHTTMPVEAATGLEDDRFRVSYLEAFGRSLAGIGPWLGSECIPQREQETQSRMRDSIRSCLQSATDPASPDFMDFVTHKQALVDAAFLADGLIRAGLGFWNSLDPDIRRNNLQCLRSTRHHEPYPSNWLLFSAIIEAFFFQVGEDCDKSRISYALHQHEEWYKGDGAYGDGPDFHWDYYNSFVIHPMLLDILDVTSGSKAEWCNLYPEMVRRSQRYAVVMERLIAPDGSFPPIGRSLAYRFGAFQLLAQMAIRKELPDELPAAQVRCALTAVIQRVIGGNGVFDEKGWLRIGLCGHQPGLGEGYITTGSLYLCTCVFLPLSLPGDSDFWAGKDQEWTSKKIWGGKDSSCDKALKEPAR